jgi:integrase
MVASAEQHVTEDRLGEYRFRTGTVASPVPDAPAARAGRRHDLHATGCRISEALALTGQQIDPSGRVVVFESLKKRRKGVYRAVPVPPELLDALDLMSGAVAICVGICLAQSAVERRYWIRQRGQPARRRACMSASAIRRLCA